jgi:hypothetical protein
MADPALWRACFAPPSYKIVPAELWHVRELAANLRVEDEKEILAMGQRPFKSIWRSYRHSKVARSVFIEDKIGAMWGICGNILGIGTIWMLTTQQMERGPAAFIREVRNEVAEMLEYYPMLCADIHNDYVRAWKMFKLVGFEIAEPKPSPNGELWRRATLTRIKNRQNRWVQ